MTIFFLFLALNLLTLTGFTVAGQINGSEPNITAVFCFGDSTLDTGNNPYLKTAFECDIPPYGKDFPGGVATGRCSNGKIPSDMLPSLIGLKKTLPPFLAPNLTDEDVITGVCFASAGSGYDNRTAAVSNVIPVLGQVPLFEEYRRKLVGIVGKEKADEILKHAVVIISAGTNDIIITYPTLKAFTPIGQYHDLMLNVSEEFVEELYDLGLRNFMVVGLPPVACLPIQKTLNLQIFRKCIDNQNGDPDAEMYNKKLSEVTLPKLEAKLPNIKIAYGDIYYLLLAIIIKPQDYGFNESQRGCCGTGKLEVGPLCSKLSTLCKNRSEYVFMDSIHPTMTAYEIIVQYLFDRNIHKLMN